MSEYKGTVYRGGEQLSGSISREVGAIVGKRRQDAARRSAEGAEKRVAQAALRPELLACIGALASETVDVLKRHNVPTDWWLNIEYRSGKREVPAWTLAYTEETTSRRTRSYIREMDYYDVTTTGRGLLLAHNRRLYALTAAATEERIAGISTSNLSKPVWTTPSNGEIAELSDDELLPLDRIVPGQPADAQPHILAWRDKLVSHAARLIG